MKGDFVIKSLTIFLLVLMMVSINPLSALATTPDSDL